MGRAIITCIAVLFLAAPAWAQTPEQRAAELRLAYNRARLGPIPWPLDPHQRLQELDEILGTDRDETMRRRIRLREWAHDATSQARRIQSQLELATVRGETGRIPHLTVRYHLARLEVWVAGLCCLQWDRDSYQRDLLRERLFPKVEQASPEPRPPQHDKAVTRITLPAGPVKWQNVRTKDGMLVRVTVGKTVVEGKRLFYGDGKAAIEVRATPDGMEFLHNHGWRAPASGEVSGRGKMSIGGERGVILIDGSRTEEPGATWYLAEGHPTADKLKPGSVYLITPSIKFALLPESERRIPLRRVK